MHSLIMWSEVGFTCKPYNFILLSLIAKNCLDKPSWLKLMLKDGVAMAAVDVLIPLSANFYICIRIQAYIGVYFP